MIHLREYLNTTTGYGRVQGRTVGRSLHEYIDANSGETVLRVSLQGIERIDVTFSLEALVAPAIYYRGQRGICLMDVGNQDVLDNIDGASRKLKQPLFAWCAEQRYHLLGLPPTDSQRAMLQYVLSVSMTSTREAAQILTIESANASNKLKQLWQQGYILRQECSGLSGGIEFAYRRIA